MANKITSWKTLAPPTAPFYAVIFISRKSENLEGYQEMDERMMKLAQQQDGYLGYTSCSNEDGGVFISYWKTEKHIAAWSGDGAHKTAKSKAQQWYAYYHSMVCKVESSTLFDAMVNNLHG